MALKQLNEFQFLIGQIIQPVKKFYIPVFSYITYPHMCKIKFQLFYIFRDIVYKLKAPCSHFPPEMGFSHIYLVDNLLFWDDQYIFFLPSFLQ